MRILAASILLVATAAYADPAAKTPAPAPANQTANQMHVDDCAKAAAKHKDCVIDMGKGETIAGNGAVGDGIGIGIVDWGKATSLIHIRRDFIVEIIKSAEDL